MQGWAHVGLLQLYTTSLPCHSGRHVENLLEFSCCFWQSDLAITTTIYASVVSSTVTNACFVTSCGCLWRNLSAKLPNLTTLWWSISLTLRTNAMGYIGDFPLWAAINWLHSALHTHTVHYMLNWRLFSMVWIYSHPIACCYLIFLLLVLQMSITYTPWVVCLVAALAASRWTNWCLYSWYVPLSDVLDEAPIDWLESDTVSPGWGVYGSLFSYCWIGGEDHNEMKWEVLINI